MNIKMSYQIISDCEGVATVAFFIVNSLCHVASGNKEAMNERLKNFFN